LAFAAAVAGPGAAALGLLACAVVTLVGWVTAAGSGTSAGATLRASGQLWLAAHHVGFSVPGGSFGLLPLGLVAVPAAALLAAGRWVALVAQVRGQRRGLAAAGGLAATYAITTVVLSGLARTSQVGPQPWQALAGGFVTAGLFGGWALLHAAGLIGPLRVRVAARLRQVPSAQPVLTGAAGATVTLLGVGAVLVAGSLAVHGSEVAAVHRAVAPGGVGGVLLTLLGVAYVPNAVIWAASYAVGPGFAVGVGTAVTPTGVRLGELPSFPLLAGLPSAEGSLPIVVALFGPLLAGIVAGALVVRASGLPPDRSRVPCAAVAGCVAGLALGVLAALAGGPLGGDRLAAVGPSPWQVALASAADLASVAALTAVVAQLHRTRSARSAVDQAP
jgi:hypothetical protein